ncbi:MAG: PRC-barrel domain-containing protein [Candidatus Berkelbacteria bacterium]
MQVAFSTIIGLPIFELRDQQQIGRIEDIIFQDDLKVIAFTVKTGGFFEQPSALFTNEIVELNKGAIFVNQEDALSPLTENIRLAEMIKNKQIGINHPVVNTDSQKTGQCDEIIFTSQTFQISRIQSKSLFGERIFDQKCLRGFKDNCFWVKDSNNVTKTTLATDSKPAA